MEILTLCLIFGQCLEIGLVKGEIYRQPNISSAHKIITATEAISILELDQSLISVITFFIFTKLDTQILHNSGVQCPSLCS